MLEEFEKIVEQLEKAKQDSLYLHDDTRFYEGKIAALEEVCRLLHLKNE